MLYFHVLLILLTYSDLDSKREHIRKFHHRLWSEDVMSATTATSITVIVNYLNSLRLKTEYFDLLLYLATL